ncbi:hypothetical protein ACFQY0_04980 [Haloferula chungangensis]|uniref:VCBS repeat-containing protein n=1 Tax=Haloferula chungangensis TaxID=1048331 RepID=A0ABW2L5F4_9BACT
MKNLPTLVIAATAMVASAIPASSEVIMGFSTGRDYLQTGKVMVEFRGGDLFVSFRDGNAILASCPHPVPFIITPNIGCPIGTTGFIADGDFDGDGIRDDLSFYSISQVIPAILVEPFRPDLCQLISAPPSPLPRPLGPFVDRGAIIFFNILTSAVYQYNVSQYEFSRNYAPGPAGRKQMDEEIVFGSYLFTFPRLGNPVAPVALPVTYSPIPEGLDLAQRLQSDPFRFTSGVFDGNGNYLMDHRLTTEIVWTGNEVSNTSTATDVMRISIYDENEEEVLFPPSGEDIVDPITGEVILAGELSAPSLIIPSPLDQSYFLPPLLTGLENAETPENVFGQQAYFRLRFQRFRGTNGITYDSSTRLFSFKILFVDSYQGFRISAFPTGQPDSTTRGTGDFDKDGQTNIEEYALGSDPDDASSMYAIPVATTDADGLVSFSMNKRPYGAAKYQFQVSTNGGGYKVIGTNDSVWEVTQDDDAAYVIRTRQAADAASFAALPKIIETVLFN